jgi:hypothetical protein
MRSAICGESYDGERAKSMKAVDLAAFQKSRWRNIAFTLTMVKTCNRLITTVVSLRPALPVIPEVTTLRI